MNITCVSLKYSKPDIFSELVSFGQEAEKFGHNLSYILSNHCNWLVEDFYKSLNVKYLGESINSKTMILDFIQFYTAKKHYIKKSLHELNPEILFFGNMHPANKLLGSIALQNGCKEIWWWLHEPYRKNKKDYGWWQKYYYTLSESFQPNFLKIVDLVVLSSKEAIKAFKDHYPWYKGKVIQVPLILIDYFIPNYTSPEKYVTFVGSAVPAKGIDLFFDLVGYAGSKHLPLKFQIVTSTDISIFLRKLSPEALSNLKIISGDRISDQKLGKVVADSLVVLTPYKRTMQSGVVPVAFMHGVPVISTDVGSMSEFVRHGETGMIIPPNASLDEWLNNIEKIIEVRDMMGKTCRECYEKHHSPENWQNIFPKMFC